MSWAQADKARIGAKEDIIGNCEEGKGTPGQLGCLGLLARSDEYKLDIVYFVLNFPKFLYYALFFYVILAVSLLNDIGVMFVMGPARWLAFSSTVL